MYLQKLNVQLINIFKLLKTTILKSNKLNYVLKAKVENSTTKALLDFRKRVGLRVEYCEKLWQIGTLTSLLILCLFFLRCIEHGVMSLSKILLTP